MSAGRHHISRERGQATMEIAAAAVAIVFLVMGFFTLGGIGITSIKSLLLTRHAAEMAAEDATSGGSRPHQLSGWEYTAMTQKRANGGEITVTIPFLAGDEEVVTTRGAGSDYLDAETDSLSFFPERARSPEDASYRFLDYRQVPDTHAPYAVYDGDSVSFAMLHVQAPELPEGTEREQNYLFRTMRNSADVKRNFRSGGWFDVEGIDITRWPSSTMAFPAFGPRR